jgi:hypothetical protein
MSNPFVNRPDGLYKADHRSHDTVMQFRVRGGQAVASRAQNNAMWGNWSTREAEPGWFERFTGWDYATWYQPPVLVERATHQMGDDAFDLLMALEDAL